MTSALQDWEALRRFVNNQPPPFGEPGNRDPDFPCEDFDARGYDGTGGCESDGHYLCAECSQLSATAPRFEQDLAGRAQRLRLFWRRPR